MADKVVRLFDVAPPGGAVDPNDPVEVAASGTIIRAGSPPALVKKLQLLLASWGFSPGTAEGTYGKNTATAVRGVQAKLGVGQDGAFGPETALAVQADLARGAASILRANSAMFRPPALPPKGGTIPTSAPQATPTVETLPATQPAKQEVPWVWILGGAAALIFLLSRFGKRDEGTNPVLAPPGSVVADLGDDDYAEEEPEDEPPPPKKKRKRRKKAKVEAVATPDEVLPPEDPAIDVEFSEVE